MTANSANRQKASRKEMSRDRAGKRKRRCATKSDKDSKTLFNAQMFFCVSKMQILPLPLTLPPPACHGSTRIQYISIYLFKREREREQERASEGRRERGKKGRGEGGRGVRAQDHFSNLALGSSATWPSRAALAVGNCFAVSI